MAGRQCSQYQSQSPSDKNLTRLRMNSAGTFNVDGVGSADTTILFATSGRGGSVDADTAKYSTKSDVKEHYRQDDKVYPLAVLLEGKFPSYYSSHPLQTVRIVTRCFLFWPRR